jgi:hypothetical protein
VGTLDFKPFLTYICQSITEYKDPSPHKGNTEKVLWFERDKGVKLSRDAPLFLYKRTTDKVR